MPWANNSLKKRFSMQWRLLQRIKLTSPTLSLTIIGKLLTTRAMVSFNTAGLNLKLNGRRSPTASNTLSPKLEKNNQAFNMSLYGMQSWAIGEVWHQTGKLQKLTRPEKWCGGMTKEETYP